MTDATYVYCPICSSPGKGRARRANGNDRCENGHTYPSADAKKTTKRGEHRREEK